VSALFSETNEFHKPPFVWVDCSNSDLEIALSGASAKVKAPQPAFQNRPKVR